MSNLVKRAFARVDDDTPVIINANDLFEKRLEEKRRKAEQRARAAGAFPEEISEDEFEGLNADQLAMLTADQSSFQSFSDGDEGGLVTQAPGAGQFDEAAAQQIISDAEEQASQILADAAGQAEEIRNNAAAQGHEEGYRAGFEEGQRAFAVQEAALAGKEKELQENYRKLVESAEPEMVEVLTRIYEHVFSVRFKEDKNVILHLLMQTLSRAEPTGDFLIHASSADYDALIDSKDALREAIPNPNCTLEIVEDTFLKENECMIETDGGVFDCGLGTELSELAKKLKLLSWDGREA